MARVGQALVSSGTLAERLEGRLGELARPGCNSIPMRSKSCASVSTTVRVVFPEG